MSPQDQTEGATLLPLLEHALEGAHPTLLDMHWRVHLSGCRYISKSGGEVSNKLILHKWLLYTPANARACIGGHIVYIFNNYKLSSGLHRDKLLRFEYFCLIRNVSLQQNIKRMYLFKMSIQKMARFQPVKGEMEAMFAI